VSILHKLATAWKSLQIKDGESSVWADMSVSSHIFFYCFAVDRNGVFVESKLFAPADVSFAVGWPGFILFLKLFLSESAENVLKKYFCLFHHFLALWIWRAEVKEVKDNMLIHHFTDYPTHSVELILSEMAGAPKYL